MCILKPLLYIHNIQQTLFCLKRVKINVQNKLRIVGKIMFFNEKRKLEIKKIHCKRFWCPSRITIN